MSNHEPYYAAKCIFRHSQFDAKDDKKYVYEDRIILIHADSMEDAIVKAEEEAKEYSDSGTEYLEYVNVFHLFDYILHHGSEVYSETRSSDLEPDDYINHFHDSGFEHCGKYT
jgi:hypothetical protein